MLLSDMPSVAWQCVDQQPARQSETSDMSHKLLQQLLSRVNYSDKKLCRNAVAKCACLLATI